MERVEFDVLAHTAAARRNMDQFAGSVDNVDRSFDDMSKGAKELDDQIGQLTRSTKDLVVEFQKTGDLELLRAAKKDKTAIQQLERMRALLGDVQQEAPKAGAAFGGLFSRAIGSPVTLGLIGAGAAAAPLIASAVSGAVVVGLGGGAVAGGLAAAFQDPRLKAEAKTLGMEIKEDFLAAGRAFEDPARRGIAKVRDEWRTTLRPEVDKTMAAATKLVDPLVDAGVGFVSEVLPGIRHAVEEAEPIFDALKSGLPQLGRATGDLFEMMGDNSEKIADGLGDALAVMTALVQTSTDGLNILIQTHDVWRDYVSSIHFAADVMNRGALVSDGQVGLLKDIRRGSDDVTGSLVSQEQAVRGLADAYQAAFQPAVSVEQANINYQRALDNLSASVKENKRTLDGTTEAGRQNREALTALAQAAVQAAEANARAGMTPAEVARTFGAQRAEVLKLAKDLKLPQAEVQRLINLLMGLPTKRTVRIDILQNGELPRVGRNVGTYTAMSQGGPVGGTGPSGVDSQLRALSPDEYVLTRPMQNALGGVAALEQLRRTGVGPTRAGAASGAQPATATAPEIDYMRLAELIGRQVGREFERVLARAGTSTFDTGRAVDLLVRGG